MLTFKIYDPEGDPATQLEVRYDGAASSTFGNDVTAICTGKINDAGVLECSELVTRVPEEIRERRQRPYGGNSCSVTARASTATS